jgi:hypothetical protein
LDLKEIKMPTRHTITHADEIYLGNAYKAGASPDGRRGIQMTHLYAHEFLSTAGAAPLTKDVDGIFASYPNTSLLSPTEIGTGANFISLASGALVTAGSTIIEFDVPRNIIFQTSGGAGATKAVLQIRGLNQYGEAMVETMTGATQTVAVSGTQLFKSIHHLSFAGATIAYATQIHNNGTIMSLGTGDRMGLPFNLANTSKLLVATVDGIPMTTSGATGDNIMTIHIGASAATAMTSSGKQADARGGITPTTLAPNGTRKYTALMIVDHTTERKAYGPPAVTAVTANY